MKLFVTGGTGFIGEHLVRALLERGDEVRALVRSRAGLDGLAVERVEGDLADARALQEGMKGVDGVFHLAARLRSAGDACPDTRRWARDLLGSPRGGVVAAPRTS